MAYARDEPPIIIDVLTMKYASTERGQRSVVYVSPRMFEQDRVTFVDGASRLGDTTPMCAVPFRLVLALIALALIAVFAVP